MNTAEFWVFIAFIVFCILFGKKVWGMLISFLDDYINSVKNELNVAKELNDESRKILDEAKRKSEEINIRIAEIKKQSEADMKEMEDKYRTVLANLVVSLEKSFTDDIEFEISVQERDLINRIKSKVLNTLKDKFQNKVFDVKSLSKHEDLIKDLLSDNQ